MKELKNVLKFRHNVCLSAWQTDGWSSLRNSKFHPFRDAIMLFLDSYLSAPWIVPASKGFVWGDNGALLERRFFSVRDGSGKSFS